MKLKHQQTLRKKRIHEKALLLSKWKSRQSSLRGLDQKGMKNIPAIPDLREIQGTLPHGPDRRERGGEADPIPALDLKEVLEPAPLILDLNGHITMILTGDTTEAHHIERRHDIPVLTWTVEQGRVLIQKKSIGGCILALQIRGIHHLIPHLTEIPGPLPLIQSLRGKARQNPLILIWREEENLQSQTEKQEGLQKVMYRKGALPSMNCDIGGTPPILKQRAV